MGWCERLPPPAAPLRDEAGAASRGSECHGKESVGAARLGSQWSVFFVKEKNLCVES